MSSQFRLFDFISIRSIYQDHMKIDKWMKSRSLNRPYEDETGSSFPVQENTFRLVTSTSLRDGNNAKPSTQGIGSVMPENSRSVKYQKIHIL